MEEIKGDKHFISHESNLFPRNFLHKYNSSFCQLKCPSVDHLRLFDFTIFVQTWL